MRATEAFYEGIWTMVNCLDLPQVDHMDLILDDYEDGMWPDDCTPQGLIEYCGYADEGGVIEEVYFRVEPENDPGKRHSFVRFIDLQAGEGYLMKDGRVWELKTQREVAPHG